MTFDDERTVSSQTTVRWDPMAIRPDTVVYTPPAYEPEPVYAYAPPVVARRAPGPRPPRPRGFMAEFGSEIMAWTTASFWHVVFWGVVLNLGFASLGAPSLGIAIATGWFTLAICAGWARR